MYMGKTGPKRELDAAEVVAELKELLKLRLIVELACTPQMLMMGS